MLTLFAAKASCHPYLAKLLMPFNEANTVEQMILDAASGLAGTPRRTAQQEMPLYKREAKRSEGTWAYLPWAEVPRSPSDVMVEKWVREALVKLNPEIAAQPD